MNTQLRNTCIHTTPNKAVKFVTVKKDNNIGIKSKIILHIIILHLKSCVKISR